MIGLSAGTKHPQSITPIQESYYLPKMHRAMLAVPVLLQGPITASLNHKCFLNSFYGSSLQDLSSFPGSGSPRSGSMVTGSML